MNHRLESYHPETESKEGNKTLERVGIMGSCIPPGKQLAQIGIWVPRHRARHASGLSCCDCHIIILIAERIAS